MKNNVTFLREKTPDKSKNAENFARKKYAFAEKAKQFLTKGRQYQFLDTLVKFANENYCCWKSVKTFADEMGVSEKTVRRSIKDLEQLDLIKVFRSRRAHARSHTNEYYLNFKCKLFDKVNMTDDCGQVKSEKGEILSEPVNQTYAVLSSCPQDTDTVTDKYKENKKNNIKTGGDREYVPIEDISRLSSINPDFMDMWFYTTGFVKRNSGINLSKIPSEKDLSAMHWVIENFSLDPKSKKDCTAICEFVFFELKEPTNIFNPHVRLKAAVEKHPQCLERFLGRYKETRKLDE